MSTASPVDELPTLDRTVIGAGLMAGAANVIMQLARPAVGYGVAESRVESGRLYDHPIKRTRTTLTYLAVATLGTDAERADYRTAVNGAHAQVFSTEDSPVRYHAMDPGLQLWVAACLYRGFEDSYEAFVGPMSEARREHVYREAAPLGTTLQVRDSMWPATREAFEDYWQANLAEVHIDDVIRDHLMSIVRLEFFPLPVQWLFGRFNTFVTTGFLHAPFREQMHLAWTTRDQRRFDRLMRAIGAVARNLPGPLRAFPYNACLWDLRLRRRLKRPLI
jgi:uncharacterized protein (DUF2236 family)